MSETLQYSIVGIILLAACVWIVIRVTKVLRGKSSGCDCCALNNACAAKNKAGRGSAAHCPNPPSRENCDAGKAARN